MGAAQVRFVPTLAGQNHQRGGSQSLERMVRISSMNGPQSLELSVSITGIHTGTDRNANPARRPTADYFHAVRADPTYRIKA